MATIAMTQPTAQPSRRSLARLAGVCQLLEALTATYGGVIIPSRLVVVHNASATAANVLAHERLFWLGFASSLIGVGFHIVWALLFYVLFRPVNKRLSQLATFVVLVACAVQAFTILFYVAPQAILQGGSSLNAFTAEQLNQLALLFFHLSRYAFNIYLVFFGLWCVLIGYLILRSTFMPRVIGVLLTIAGLGWMTYLVPPIATHVFPIIASASALGEIPLEFWLIIKGVNEQRWQEQALSRG